MYVCPFIFIVIVKNMVLVIVRVLYKLGITKIEVK